MLFCLKKPIRPFDKRSDDHDSLNVLFLRVSSLTVWGVMVHIGEEGAIVKLIGLEKVKTNVLGCGYFYLSIWNKLGIVDSVSNFSLTLIYT